MDRYEFLRMVLPPLGEGCTYVGHYGGSKPDGTRIQWNRKYDTIEEIADAAVRESSRGNTAYFALGTFANNITPLENGRIRVGRLASQAVQFKTMALDIDVGKEKNSYATTKDAVAALLKFLKDTDLPAPLVVLSGHGLHVYWPLETPISALEWQGYGEQLLRIVQQHNFIADPSKVHDRSMVLRPLDTQNKGELVRLGSLGGGVVHNNTLFDRLNALVPSKSTPKPLKLTASQMIAEESLTAQMLAVEEAQYPRADAALLVKACAQIREATKDGGKNASYWQWFLTLGVSRYTTTPEETAIEWAGNHPEFSVAAQDTKLSQMAATGFPKCSTFDHHTPGICGKCPHWRQVQSPYQLGLPLPEKLPAKVDMTEMREGEVIPAQEFDIDPYSCTPSIDPPAPFQRTKKGIIAIAKKEGDVETAQDICPYDIFPINMVRDPALGYSMVEWVWNKPHVGYTGLLVRTSSIFNDSSTVELNNTLADNGILIDNKFKQNLMAMYMRAYTLLLQKHQASIDLYDSFGWKDDFKRFVIGSTELRLEPNGEVTTHEVGVSKLIVDKQYHKTFGVKGNMDEWVAWTKVFDHPTLYLHQVEIARGFLTPLIVFTGLKGIVYSLIGDSGHGKSTCQRIAGSIYGDPNRVNTTAQDTQMSVAQRMGVWGNLPVGMDEGTLLKPEFLANLIYWGSQGQDRNRVSEVNQALQWALSLSISTNSRIRDKISAFGADVDAIHMRLIEFELPISPLFAKDSSIGRRLYLMSENHYGHVGRVYIAFLLKRGEEQIKRDIEEGLDTFSERYGIGFEGPERFWQMSAVLTELALKYATQLGLIKFDYRNGVKAMVADLLRQREAVQGKRLDIYDMLTEYLTMHNGAAVSVNYPPGSRGIPKEPMPRGEVRIRKEFYPEKVDSKPTKGFFYIDKVHFQHWLFQRGFDFKAGLDRLMTEQAAFRPSRSGRIYMGKDTGITLPSCAAIGFNMNHEKFQGMLQQYDFAAPNVVSMDTPKEKK